MKHLFIIPARGGSKGIPGKNLIKLGGKPLIEWTINAAKMANIDKTIVVTSDDPDILAFAKRQGVEACERPIELAQDTSTTNEAIVHLLAKMQYDASTYEYIVLLQPTSPLRTSEHIEQALQTISASNASALVSVYEPQHHPLKAFRVDNEGCLQGIADNKSPFMPRQSLPQAVYPNGAIFIVKLEAFEHNNRLFQAQTIPFLMEERESIDIDSLIDLKSAEKLLRE